MKIEVNKDVYMETLTLNNAEEIFGFVEANRDYLKKWLPWVVEADSVEIIEGIIESWNKSYESGTDLAMGVFKNNKYIGNIGLYDMKRSNNSGMIGYWLDESEQGNGIITSCVKALTDYGFNALSLNRIYIYCADKNFKSRAVPERLGFTLEGFMQDGELIYDEYFDLAVYGMVKRNW